MKTITTAVALLLVSSCTTVSTRRALDVSPEVLAAGSTVYFGSSFPLKGTATEPLFIYERRVGEDSSMHITRTPTGELAIVESATHSPEYALREYTLHTNQTGHSGSVRVDGEQITLRLNDGTGERTVTERQTLPVVTGPTLVGFVFQHLEQLRRGESFKVRLVVLDRLETIGFELKSVEGEPGQTRVKLSADSFFISLAVAPIFFTFDSATGKLVRLEGRIPPKVKSGDSWKDLDARVEYRFVAGAYR